MTAAIRPTQFSGLKVLDPFDDQGEHGEHDNRDADEKQIPHWTSASSGGCCCVPRSSKPLVSLGASHLDGSYAAPAGFLTDLMREPGVPPCGPPGSLGALRGVTLFAALGHRDPARAPGGVTTAAGRADPWNGADSGLAVPAPRGPLGKWAWVHRPRTQSALSATGPGNPLVTRR